MHHVILLIVLTCCLVFNIGAIGAKSIEVKESRMNVSTTEKKNTTKSLEMISRSSIIDDPPNHYQSSKNLSSDTKIDLCSGVKDQNRCLISALSRIAKIRIDNATADPKYRLNLEIKKKNELVLPRLPKGNYHCHVLDDFYMPEDGQKLPAYICQLYEKIFVLTSDRFFKDRRSYFNIYVDEEIAPNWIVAGSTNAAVRTVGVKKLPVTLVLKSGENNYRIRNKF